MIELKESKAARKRLEIVTERMKIVLFGKRRSGQQCNEIVDGIARRYQKAAGWRERMREEDKILDSSTNHVVEVHRLKKLETKNFYATEPIMVGHIKKKSGKSLKYANSEQKQNLRCSVDSEVMNEEPPKFKITPRRKSLDLSSGNKSKASINEESNYKQNNSKKSSKKEEIPRESAENNPISIVNSSSIPSTQYRITCKSDSSQQQKLDFNIAPKSAGYEEFELRNESSPPDSPLMDLGNTEKLNLHKHPQTKPSVTNKRIDNIKAVPTLQDFKEPSSPEPQGIDNYISELENWVKNKKISKIKSKYQGKDTLFEIKELDQIES